MTTVTALPPAPSRGDSATFAAVADTFVAALPTLVTEINTVAGEINTNASTASTAATTATSAAGSATASASAASSSASTATTRASEASAAAAAAAASAASAFGTADVQAQTKTAFTSAGTQPAFTVTTSPAYGTLAAGQRMRVEFHASGTTGSNTINRDATGVKNLKQFDSTGAKVPAVITNGMRADVEYDGTDYIVLDPLPTGDASTTAKGIVELATEAETVTGTSTTLVPSVDAFRKANIVSSAAIATTSGTAHDITGVPAWAKRITVNFSGVSTNGTPVMMLQLGDPGGVESSGYSGTVVVSNSFTGTSLAAAPGFYLTTAGTASDVFSGSLVLSLMDSSANTWVLSGMLAYTSAGVLVTVAGAKSLSAALDRLRLTTETGVSTFDAGKINVFYE